MPMSLILNISLTSASVMMPMLKITFLNSSEHGIIIETEAERHLYSIDSNPK